MSTKDEDALELAVESALAEYLLRMDEGAAPDREQFLAQHPQMREKLAELLAAADWIEQLAGPTIASMAALEPEANNDLTLPVNSSGMISDPNEDTQPLTPARDGSESLDDQTLDHAKSRLRASSGAGSDPHSLTLPGNSQSLVPQFSLGSLTPAQEMSQLVLPCRFGDYVLERVLGRGGMGVVYAGHQTNLDRPVAIKMIRSGALASSEEVQRFYTEARSAAQLDHPNIVTVYQCGEHEGHHYFSMDLVTGTDLSKLIQGGPMEAQRAARYVRDVARAIQFAHARGILHRDLKPANVLVDENDQVHVTDFGLAKSIGTDTGLTATGAALGTPSYMSPEQASGRTDEHAFQTDVYSLGAVLFALVTGKPPFQSASVVQTIMQVMHRPAPLARTVFASVPAELETIIAKCLHKSPERRYASAQALADDLDRYLSGEPILAKPLSPMRRAIYWSMGVPIVAAVVGRRVLDPSPAHTWTQRGILAAILLIFCVLATRPTGVEWQSQRLPKTVRFAAGQVGGSYDFVGRVICEELETLLGRPAASEITEGSLDNRKRLIDRKVDLALLQGSTLHSDEIAVIAPLYYEAIHVLVRSDRPIDTIGQLRGYRVIVGPEGSGSRAVAQQILKTHEMELADIEPVATDWLSIDAQNDVDAAIVVVQVGNARMHELLGGGRYKLLPLDDAVELSLDDPAFRLLPITREYYPNAQLPDRGFNTVATTAYLTTRTDCPDALVQKALAAIYTPHVQSTCKLLSPQKAAAWDVAWHRAAKEFYKQYRGTSIESR